MRIEIEMNMVIPPPNAFTIDPGNPLRAEVLFPTPWTKVCFDVSPDGYKALHLRKLEERLAEDVSNHFMSIVKDTWEPSHELLEAQVRAINKKRRDEERAKREEGQRCH